MPPPPPPPYGGHFICWGKSASQNELDPSSQFVGSLLGVSKKIHPNRTSPILTNEPKQTEIISEPGSTYSTLETQLSACERKYDAEGLRESPGNQPFWVSPNGTPAPQKMLSLKKKKASLNSGSHPGGFLRMPLRTIQGVFFFPRHLKKDWAWGAR